MTTLPLASTSTPGVALDRIAPPFRFASFSALPTPPPPPPPLAPPPLVFFAPGLNRAAHPPAPNASESFEMFDPRFPARSRIALDPDSRTLLAAAASASVPTPPPAPPPPPPPPLPPNITLSGTSPSPSSPASSLCVRSDSSFAPRSASSVAHSAAASTTVTYPIATADVASRANSAHRDVCVAHACVTSSPNSRTSAAMSSHSGTSADAPRRRNDARAASATRSRRLTRASASCFARAACFPTRSLCARSRSMALRRRVMAFAAAAAAASAASRREISTSNASSSASGELETSADVLGASSSAPSVAAGFGVGVDDGGSNAPSTALAAARALAAVADDFRRLRASAAANHSVSAVAFAVASDASPARAVATFFSSFGRSAAAFAFTALTRSSKDASSASRRTTCARLVSSKTTTSGGFGGFFLHVPPPGTDAETSSQRSDAIPPPPPPPARLPSKGTNASPPSPTAPPRTVSTTQDSSRVIRSSRSRSASPRRTTCSKSESDHAFHSGPPSSNPFAATPEPRSHANPFDPIASALCVSARNAVASAAKSARSVSSEELFRAPNGRVAVVFTARVNSNRCVGSFRRRSSNRASLSVSDDTSRAERPRPSTGRRYVSDALAAGFRADGGGAVDGDESASLKSAAARPPNAENRSSPPPLLDDGDPTGDTIGESENDAAFAGSGAMDRIAAISARRPCSNASSSSSAPGTRIISSSDDVDAAGGSVISHPSSSSPSTASSAPPPSSSASSPSPSFPQVTSLSARSVASASASARSNARADITSERSLTIPETISSVSVNGGVSLTDCGSPSSDFLRRLPRSRATSISNFEGCNGPSRSVFTLATNPSTSTSLPSRCNSSIASPISEHAMTSSALGDSSARHDANSGARFFALNTSSHTRIVASVGRTFTNKVSSHCELMMPHTMLSGASDSRWSPTPGRCACRRREKTL
mmetsp:Transcript_3371/g.11352  ORF Transcript_3371/g.11352 Transcript_3371/m.11352 type:complete len:947 (-) Transcript_3371:2316-5156(-)